MKKNVVVALLVLVIAGFAFGVYEVLFLQKAHSTFDNYYAFRGCTQLLERTDNYGICKLASGETIKIVKYQNRWFLDGDLPCGFLCF
jgi:hypothetical protein